MLACSYSFPLVRLAASTAPLRRRPRNSRTAGFFERVARIADRALTGRSPDFQLYSCRLPENAGIAEVGATRCSLLAASYWLLAACYSLLPTEHDHRVDAPYRSEFGGAPAPPPLPAAPRPAPPVARPLAPPPRKFACSRCVSVCT